MVTADSWRVSTVDFVSSGPPEDTRSTQTPWKHERFGYKKQRGSYGTWCFFGCNSGQRGRSAVANGAQLPQFPSSVLYRCPVWSPGSLAVGPVANSTDRSLGMKGYVLFLPQMAIWESCSGRSQSPPIDWDERVCFIAAETGHLEVRQWLRSQSPPCHISLFLSVLLKLIQDGCHVIEGGSHVYSTCTANNIAKPFPRAFPHRPCDWCSCDVGLSRVVRFARDRSCDGRGEWCD